MKKMFFVLVLILIPSFVFAGDVYTKGHYRDSDGDGYKETYVDGYNRSSPNKTKDDNYSTYPNVNPYTGKQGTERNDNDSGYGNNSGYSGYGSKKKGNRY